MRILHLCTADHGGAGVAAQGLHRAMLRMGAESQMIVASRRGDDARILALGPRAASPLGPGSG
jgi:hypothetical protein